MSVEFWCEGQLVKEMQYTSHHLEVGDCVRIEEIEYTVVRRVIEITERYDQWDEVDSPYIYYLAKEE